MSRIVLTATNSIARYWGLRVLEQFITRDPETYGHITHAEIQSLATTLKIKEVTDRQYTPARKVRLVTITGMFKGLWFTITCEQQEMWTNDMGRGWFLVRVEGYLDVKRFASLVRTFKDEGCPQPPMSF